MLGVVPLSLASVHPSISHSVTPSFYYSPHPSVQPSLPRPYQEFTRPSLPHSIRLASTMLRPGMQSTCGGQARRGGECGADPGWPEARSRRIITPRTWMDTRKWYIHTGTHIYLCLKIAYVCSIDDIHTYVQVFIPSRGVAFL